MDDKKMNQLITKKFLLAINIHRIICHFEIQQYIF